MSQILIKAAQKATQNTTLLAALIQTYGRRHNLTWEQIAQELNLNMEQLAQLALCRRPRSSLFNQDVKQITAYVGIKKATLTQFLQRAEGKQTEQIPWWRWKIFRRGIQMILQRRTLAIVVVACVIVLLSAFALAQPARIEATLVVTQGQAIVRQTGSLLSGQSEQTVLANEVVMVGTGDEIVLSAAAAAQLRLYDGSTVDLFENTTVEVTDLNTTEDSYRVRLNMLVGKTISRGERVLGIGDAFGIKAPCSRTSLGMAAGPAEKL